MNYHQKTALWACGCAILCGIVIVFCVLDVVQVHTTVRDHERSSCEVVNVVWKDDLVGNFTISVNDKKISKVMNCNVPEYAKNERQNCIFHVNFTFWAYYDHKTNNLVISLPHVTLPILPIMVFGGLFLFCVIVAWRAANELFKQRIIGI